MKTNKDSFIRRCLAAGTTLFLVFIAHTQFAQQNQVPATYIQLKEVSGDLDKDGINERVIVYNTTNDDQVIPIKRELIIFKKKGRAWTIWQRSMTAVGDNQSGGMMGDPFESIEIKKGILLIYHYGGSSWRWSTIDKYRFQNSVFELIGYTGMYGKDCEYTESVDYNLSTGALEAKKQYENCDNDTKTTGKTENETFVHKLKNKITLDNRKMGEWKILTPEYKRELYF